MFIVETANAASTQTELFTTPSSTPTLTPTATITATPVPTDPATPTPIATLAAYEKYTIEYLRSRPYGIGQLDLIEVLWQEEKFTTYSARYVSDDLYIYVLVNIPNDAGVCSVVISIHGYASPNSYNLLQDNMAIDNELARHGFITIHPAMRNYRPSDKGDNLFRVGHAIDILNLIAIIKVQSGQPGILENADPDRIGIAGASAGGGVALRVLTVSADVKAAWLYSSISGDERRNVPFFDYFAKDPQFDGETATSERILEKISPSSYYQLITAPVLLAHGAGDWTIPLTWAKETCDLLKSADVNITCVFYKRAQHTFLGEDLGRLIDRPVKFYQTYLH